MGKKMWVFDQSLSKERMETYMNAKQWMHIFSTRLIKEMHERGINRRELAELSGVSENSISNYINENREPKITNIIKISEALEIPVNKLIY